MFQNPNRDSNERRSTSASGRYMQLDQSLIEPVENVLPVTTATPMIEVVAPSNLPENYTFQAQVGDKTFTVTVPPGGVEQGQRFSVSLNGGQALDDSMMLPRSSVPVGHWKDGLFSCFNHGVFHPLLWNAFFCTPIVTGQVMTRMQLTCCGKSGSVAETASTFKTVLYIVIAYHVIDRLLWLTELTALIADGSDGDAESISIAFFLLGFLRSLMGYGFFFYTVFTLWRVRVHMRQKFAIPEAENCPANCEDILVVLCCSWCASAQMARHTADYDTYSGTCCSETGLPSHVPAIV